MNCNTGRSLTTGVTDCVAQLHINALPPSFGSRVQYYKRIGQRFYFRSLDTPEKITFYTSPSVCDKLRKDLKFLGEYQIKSN